MIRVLCAAVAIWMGDDPVVVLGIAQASLGFSVVALTLAALLAPPVQSRLVHGVGERHR